MLTSETLQMICVIVSALCLAYLMHSFLRRRTAGLGLSNTHNAATPLPAFLFEGHDLVDATEPARELIGRSAPDLAEFDRLLYVLREYFPALADQISDLPDTGNLHLYSPKDDSLSLRIDKQNNSMRVVMNGSDHFKTLLHYETLEQDAFHKETETLRFICENAPQLIWQEDNNGQIVWANKAYFRYSDRKTEISDLTGKTWPAHRLFEDVKFPIPTDAGPLTKRRSIQLHEEKAEHWFDVTSMPGPDGALHYAVDANEIMRAEESQQAFMKAIANTFAHLSIGLAIFDRKRRLSSYNPAFGELTGLPATFLIGRPAIDTVLDRLRDSGRLPEPKDYASFRDQFIAFEAEAQNGNYVENWEMPDGQTFRVTGRPHPDGALAFLFEDVTAEISLTRRFRNEIEVGHSVLDNITDAVAVFSATQNLIMSNKAYEDLWGDTAQSAQDLRSSLRLWKSNCAASSTWRSIETSAGARSDRQSWSEPVILLDGRQFDCCVYPLNGNMMMVKFTRIARLSRTLQTLKAADPALRANKR